MNRVDIDTRNLTLVQKVALLNKAFAIGAPWHVDTLNCKVSIMRVTVEMPFDEIVATLTDGSHFVFIVRDDPPDEAYIDLGFRTKDPKNKDAELFLFMRPSIFSILSDWVVAATTL